MGRGGPQLSAKRTPTAGFHALSMRVVLKMQAPNADAAIFIL